MKSSEIFDYCREKNLRLCLKTLSTCPFKEFYKDTYFCNFGNFLVDFYLNKRYQKTIDHYLEGVCSNIRCEILEDKEICGVAKERKEKILDYAKIGDKVFCIPKFCDVILLEKAVGINKMCRYRTVDGNEGLVHPHYLSIVSKGNSFMTFIINEEDEMFEFKARKLGFRVEKRKVKDQLIYKIYGDTQQEVNDFVSNYHEQKTLKK